MITITQTHTFCQIHGLTDVKIIDKLDHKLSYYISGYQFTQAFKRHFWDGRKHLLDSKLKFQSGLLLSVEEFLQKNSLEYEIKDERQNVILGESIILNPNFHKPRDYQIETVDKCLEHRNGIIKSCTGSGKTLTISLLIARTNVKTVIYVISLDLLYQTKKAIEDALNIECGIVGDGNCIIKKITIATIWSVAHAYNKEAKSIDDEQENIKEKNLDSQSKNNIQKMVEASEMFVLDECQLASCTTFQLIAQNSKNAEYRFGFSGTPYREDGADLALTAATGEQLIDINATTLIERGFLSTPRIFFFEVPELPGYEKDNRNRLKYQQIYDKYIVENQVRNEIIIASVTKLHAKGRKILLLVRRKKHGLKLLEMMKKYNIRTYMLNGDAPAEERQAVKDLFNMDGLDLVISSGIFDAGIDLPKLDALILAGGGKSSTKALQRIGRVLRIFPGKKNALVADFIDQAPFAYNHSQIRYNIYTREKAFEIKLPNGFEW